MCKRPAEARPTRHRQSSDRRRERPSTGFALLDSSVSVPRFRRQVVIQPRLRVAELRNAMSLFRRSPRSGLIGHRPAACDPRWSRSRADIRPKPGGAVGQLGVVDPEPKPAPMQSRRSVTSGLVAARHCSRIPADVGRPAVWATLQRLATGSTPSGPGEVAIQSIAPDLYRYRLRKRILSASLRRPVDTLVDNVVSGSKNVEDGS
jgi:hypothetical protein